MAALMRVALTHKLLLLGILAIANISLLICLGWRKLQMSAQTATAEESLPAIELLDDTGKRVWLNSLTGKPLVLHFVDPQVTQEIDSITNLIGAFETSEVQFVLVTQKSQDLRRVLPALPENVMVVQSNYAELKKAFKVPECCERRFVFNANGKLEYRDYYYEANLTPRVNSLVKKKLTAPSKKLVELLNSQKTGRFASFKEQTVHSASGKGVVVLFTSISSTCPSGELAALIGRSTKRQGVDFLILLPREYSRADLENLRTNFKINFEVEQFDPALAGNLASLVDLYGEPRINGSVIFIDHGKISVSSDLAETEDRLSRF